MLDVQTMSDPHGPNAAGRASQSDPQPDRQGWRAPARIAEVHAILVILNTYAGHLYDTIQHRAVARGFATIAQFFGTAATGTIIAHLCRGMMRCHALSRLLQARAARGHDLAILARRGPARHEPAGNASDPPPAAAPPPPPTLTPEDEATARAAAAARAEARIARRIADSQPLTFATLPSMAQIEAEVCRSTVGRSIVLICRDLGVSPALCEGAFWNRLFDAIRWYGGSLAQVVLEMKRRERVFEKQELDRNPALGWPEQTREGMRRVLGFFIGEKPVNPFIQAVEAGARMAAALGVPGSVPGAAAATGPP